MNLIDSWTEIECIDLSVPLSPHFPVTWPGLPQFRKSILAWFEDYRNPNGETVRSVGGYYDQFLELDEHTGTHVDFPSHILRPGELSEVESRFGAGPPLRTFAGPAAVIDATAFLDSAEVGRSLRVPLSVFEEWERIHGQFRSGDVALMDTGYTDRYFRALPEGERFVKEVVASGVYPGWPVPSDEVLQLLAQRGVRHLGVSSPSIGALDDSAGPHRTGMRLGLTFAESLIGLRHLPARGAFYIGFPLKIEDQSGSPIRAAAFIGKTVEGGKEK